MLLLSDVVESNTICKLVLRTCSQGNGDIHEEFVPKIICFQFLVIGCLGIGMDGEPKEDNITLHDS